MQSNILFLQSHSVDEQGLIGQLKKDNCNVCISRLNNIDDLEKSLARQSIDLFVIKASNQMLVEYAQKLLTVIKNRSLSVLYIMEKDDTVTRDKLIDFTAKHILCGEQTTDNLASVITLVIRKNRYKRQLNAMGAYIKEATVVCEKDVDGDFVFKNINKVFLELEGIEESSILEKKVKDSHLIFGLQDIIEDMHEVYDTGSSVHMPNYFYIKDDQREWCDVYIYNSNPGQVSVVSSNLSEVKRAHDKSVQSNRYLQTILNAQNHIIYITDGNKLINTNQAFLNFFECDTMYRFIKTHGKVCNVFEKATEPFYIDTDEPGWHRKVSENRQERYKIRIKHKEAVKVFVPSVDIINIDDKEQYVVVLTDVTELESEKEKLRVLAMSDPLTGASNRLQFNTMIDNFIAVSRRYNTPLSIMMFDIDHFKQVNDNYSHEVGDTILKQLVTIVSEHVREADLFVRWGGEEFLIVLSNTSLENAALAAQKFRASINEASFDKVGEITCSFGVSEMHSDDTISDFISRVDEALYQAKSAGRNCVKSMP